MLALSKLKDLFAQAMPVVDFASMRYHADADEAISVRQNILQPLTVSRDEGVMVTVHHKGGIGYGATSDLSLSGLRAAFAQAQSWAQASAGRAVTDYSKIQMPHPKGEFHSPVQRNWDSLPLKDKIERLTQVSQTLKQHAHIVDWEASLWRSRSERVYLTNGGGELYQDFDRLVPGLRVTANRGSETATRTYYGHAVARQQGLELLDDLAYYTAGHQIAAEALQLLDADNCPSGVLDLLLDPDQMVLQIHESIGHPLELDRILGDERNYAGTSFVTLDMFGRYRYGSDLLNVTIDSSYPEEAASLAFDDDGQASRKEYLIRAGMLEKPLGGLISTKRAHALGFETSQAVANTRADSWRRPAIDRMSNINIEPGSSRLQDMLAAVERGIYMKTNCSWSIDDSRNKFQFGCEWAQLIENGQLTKVVKKPNYRGISANFWRNLKMVGNRDSHAVMGTPYCGKGEPNQAVFVGHATPACLFSDIDVFGGE